MDSERTHFDAIAPHYYDMVDAVRQDNGYYHREELALVRDVLGRAREPLWVLDAGCGPGRISRALVEQGHEVVSMDISAKMLDEVEAVLGPSRRSRAVQADVRTLPFADGSFDAVVCMEVLEHLPGHTDDAWRVIEEFTRVLADDGLLLIEAPLRPHEQLRQSHPAFRADWSGVGQQVWQRYEQAPLGTWLHYDDDQVREVLASCGLDVLGARYIRILPAGLFDRFGDLDAIDRALERQPEVHSLAREAIWVARRRTRPGAVHAPPRVPFDPACLAASAPSTERLRAAATGLADAGAQLVGLRARLTSAEADLAAQREGAERTQAAQEQARADLTRRIERLEGRLAHAHAELEQLYGSTGWQLLQGLWALRTRVAPHGSVRERALCQPVRAARLARRVGVRGAAQRALRPLFDPPPPFAERYVPEDSSVVTLYTDDPRLFPGHRPRRLVDSGASSEVGVSLVAAMRNERDNVDRWVRGVLGQTRLPDEVIVVDGGSDDGSADALRAAAADSPVPFRVLEPGPAAIARSRNLAIEAARGPVIAVTDFGARLRPAWLERITAPFEADATTEVVGGFYAALDRSGRTLDRALWPRLDQVDPASFLPSSRSIAFRKTAWEAVRGYPEWLTLTGEDTYFALELKRSCRNWAFVPGALVEWEAPDSLRAYWRKAHDWSIGDGETGLFAAGYWQSAVRAGAATLAVATPALLAVAGAGLRSRTLLRGARLTGGVAALGVAVAGRRRGVPPRRVLAEYGAQVNRVRGFVAGTRRRAEADRRRERLRAGVLLMLAGVPIDDTGGGARCTQIALELLRRGWKIVYVNRFPKYESVELGLRIAHPDLETLDWSRFDVDAFLARHLGRSGDVPIAALVEFPLPEFLPALRRLDDAGVSVVYDLIDDWDTSLGAGWYSATVEREVAARADVLVATVPDLVQRLEQMTGAQAAFLPNAVDLRLFDPDRPYDLPADLPGGAWRIAYVGALWGDWFDWDLLADVAWRYPEAAMVVIGDYRGQCPVDLDNLHFLGLKAQRQIPAYLAAVDVAIIPWKVNDITRATSPLKLFEYLAMRKPVVAPDLPPLRDIPGVLLSTDRKDFIADVARARHHRIDTAQLDEFLSRNSWQARVDELSALIQKA